MRVLNDLRKYQRQGVRHLTSADGVGLFLDMGMGKTVITLTAFVKLTETFEAYRGLIIAPKRVAETVWVDEAKEWEHLAHLKIVVVNGDENSRVRKLKEKADLYCISIDNAIWLAGYKGFGMFDTIILDESSMVKNPNTQRFKVLKKHFTKVPKRIILTGTPTPNSMLELWTQLYLIDLGKRLNPNITRFRSLVAVKDFHGFGYAVKKGYENKILSMIKDICLSIRAKDYGFTIPVVHNTVKVYLSKKEQEKYNQFEADKVMEMLDSCEDDEGVPLVTAVNAAVLTNKLLQFANGAIYDEDRNVHTIHSAKLEALADIFLEVKTPILVAYSFSFDKDRIYALAKKMGKRVQIFTDSKQVYEWNNREIDVFLLHPKSGGHGLNLQKGGHHIVWFGSTFSVEAEQQLNARLARSGQTDTVVITKLVTMGTVEESIAPKVDKKIKVQNAVLEYLRDKGFNLKA